MAGHSGKDHRADLKIIRSSDLDGARCLFASVLDRPGLGYVAGVEPQIARSGSMVSW
jgi:hypothetical protein